MTLIDTATAAAMVRCTPRHIRDLITRGVLHNHGTTRRALVSLDALQDAINRGEVTPTPKRGRRAGSTNIA